MNSFFVFVALFLARVVVAQDHLWMVQTTTKGYCTLSNCNKYTVQVQEVIVHGIWPVDRTGITLKKCKHPILNPIPDVCYCYPFFSFLYFFIKILKKIHDNRVKF